MVYIIIPVYNTAAYLRDCLRSVFNSDYKDICVICIDDGSTDESPEILLDYSKQHANLIVFTTDNNGLGPARNVGLEYVNKRASPNDFLLFVDSDDFIGQTYISELVKFSEAGDYSIVCSSFTFCSQDRRWVFKGMDCIFGEYDSYDASRILLEDKTVQSHAWSKLFRVYVWGGICFPRVSFMEDQPTIFRTFCQARKILFLKNYDCFYRQREASLCASDYTPQKAIDAIKGYLACFTYNFDEFDEPQKGILKKAASQALAACYLSVSWRFEWKMATKNQREEWRIISEFIKRNRIINNYIPTEKKEKWKRFFFLYFRAIYRPLFHFADMWRRSRRP